MRKDFGSKPWFYPLPVLIVATYDENGKPDAMNAAWGGLYQSDMVELCLGAQRKTTKNLLKTKGFTVSFADEKNVIASDYVGIVSGNNTPDKMGKSGFTTVKSEHINAPIINELPFTLECEYVKTTSEGNIIGKIVNISVDESILDENGNVDFEKFKPISFEPIENTYRVLGDVVGKAFSDGNKLK